MFVSKIIFKSIITERRPIMEASIAVFAALAFVLFMGVYSIMIY